MLRPMLLSLRRMSLSQWPCLLAAMLHLLAPLCHAARHLPRDFAAETANGSPFTANSPTVEYTRGPDMGGGVGGLLYSSRSEGILPSSTTLKCAQSNGRGDIVAQSDQNAVLTWTASYEAYGKRTREAGSNADKQRANSKDEDPTGLLNEGFRYRDLETGVWLSRDPAGFVDGPNLYAYVKQNPWTAWDPDGLESFFGYDPATLTPTERQVISQSDRRLAVAGAAITVGVGVSVATGGAAAPFVAKLGLGATGSMLTTAAVSGAAGGAASQMTSNTLTGQPVMQNVPQAAGTGAVLNMASGVLGQSVAGFKEGFREGTALAAAGTAARQAAANGASGGIANAMVSAEGTVLTGFSKNAGGGPVSPGVSSLYGSARKTCAEARTLTQAELSGVNMTGGTSAAVSVGPFPAPLGTPMRACEQACAPVLKRLGIGDAVAGTSGASAPAATVPVPVIPYRAPDKKKEEN